jgi:RNase P/RNase MRP subunit p30
MKDYVLATPVTAQSLIAQAEVFGFTELVVLCTPVHAEWLAGYRDELRKTTPLRLFFGLLVEKQRDIPKKNDFDEIVLLGTSEIAVFPGVTRVLNKEYGEDKDAIHQRRSGLNHVLAQAYKKKNIGVLCEITTLKQLKPQRQAQIFGRIKQNLFQARKHNISYELCTFAQTPFELRHAKDLASLTRIL